MVSPPTPTVAQLLRRVDHHAHVASFAVGDAWTVLTWADRPELCTDVQAWPLRVREGLRKPHASRLPFTSGWVGWVGYEAGAAVESMPARTSTDQPPLCLWRAEGALCLEHSTGRWHVAGTPDFRGQAHAALTRAASQAEVPLAPPPDTEGPRDGAAYVASVQSILRDIRAGRVYQVNLAWRQTGLRVPDPLGVHLALAEHNPAARGAYLRNGRHVVISNSPELFLRVDGATGRCTSTPIKGTLPHHTGEAGQDQLRADAKEKAELTMIVDLVRSDLGKIAHPGSVVAGARTIRACGDLWHAEQSVVAQLAEGKTGLDAFAACFPPGSVTGAPKVEAMKVIRELEPGPRGAYTGAIGWFGDDGGCHFNVAIRTLEVEGERGSFHVGAGIVADSQPEREWAETLAKGHALRAAIHRGLRRGAA